MVGAAFPGLHKRLTAHRQCIRPHGLPLQPSFLDALVQPVQKVLTKFLDRSRTQQFESLSRFSRQFRVCVPIISPYPDHSH